MKLASITFQISKKTPEIVRETGCKLARSVKVGVSVTRKNLVTLVGVNHWESVDVAPMKLLLRSFTKFHQYWRQSTLKQVELSNHVIVQN